MIAEIRAFSALFLIVALFLFPSSYKVRLFLYFLFIISFFAIMGKDNNNTHDEDSSIGSEKKARVYCAGPNCKPRIRMSSLDCHKLCIACRGYVCSYSKPCDYCRDWSRDDWELFRKRIDRNVQKAISKREKKSGSSSLKIS